MSTADKFFIGLMFFLALLPMALLIGEDAAWHTDRVISGVVQDKNHTPSESYTRVVMIGKVPGAISEVHPEVWSVSVETDDGYSTLDVEPSLFNSLKIGDTVPVTVSTGRWTGRQFDRRISNTR